MFFNRFKFFLSFLALYLACNCGLKAADAQQVFVKNISSNKPVYVALGFKLRVPQSRGFFSRQEVKENYFIAEQSLAINAQRAATIDLPLLCKDLYDCPSLAETLEPQSLAGLKSALEQNNAQKSELIPVAVISWSKDLFTLDKAALSEKKSLEDTGALILEAFNKEGKTEQKFVDVVEWKDIGTNLQAGFLNTIEKWQRLKEPPFVQVVSYDRALSAQTIKATSYASYPVYLSVITCEIDITSLHEGRTCSVAMGPNGKPLPLYRLEKDKKQSITFYADVRAFEYFKDRPAAFSKIATRNPYQVYLVASPFREDVDQYPRNPSHTLSTMRNVLTNTRYHRIASINALEGGYDSFYVYQNNKGISFFVGEYLATDVTSKLLNKLASIASPWSGSLLPVGQQYVENMMRFLKNAVDPNVVKVIDRTNASDALSNAEKTARTAIKKAIYSFVKESEEKGLSRYLPKTIDLNDVAADMMPNVAFAPSGGGYRAALATLGFKNGLFNNRADQLLLYQAGLSGSTWYFAKLLQMANSDWSYKTKTKSRVLDQNFYRKLSEDLRVRPQYNSAITNFLSFPNFEKEHAQLLAFFAPMLVRWSFLQEITLVDVMGAGLWYNLFREIDPFELKFSNFQDLMKSGEVPFTLMTAVTKTPAMMRDDYLWFEFSPFEIGATLFDRFVPTSSFGRYFIDGSSVTTAPELTLPFLMGTWGSAMSAGILDGLRQEVIPQSLKLKAELPLINDILTFVEVDYPAISTLAAIMTKYELDKSDVRELLRYAIKYVDKLAFAPTTTNKSAVARLKVKLEDAQKRLSEIPLGTYDYDIDQLSWLYEEDVKPYATSLFALQPDRVSFISKKLSNANKISEIQAFSGAIVGNPYYEMDFPGNVLKDLPSLELRDGGVDFNIPFPPLVKPARDMDIIIAFDASPDVFDKVKALENGCRYAERHAIKRFPVQECLAFFKDAEKKQRLIKDVVTVIGDPGSLNTMTIIYVPLKTFTKENYEAFATKFKKDYRRYIDWNPHNDVTGTMNLRYTPEQVDELASFGEMLGDAVSQTIHEVFGQKLRARINAGKGP